MSYIALYQQLSLEFKTAPEFDHARARDDAFALCANWRNTVGRHVPMERVSEEFGHWWRVHYSDCLKAAGAARSYSVFLEALAEKIKPTKIANFSEV